MQGSDRIARHDHKEDIERRRTTEPDGKGAEHARFLMRECVDQRRLLGHMTGSPVRQELGRLI
jgi:hypothetical protein